MKIARNSIDTNRGPSEWFTGAVYVDTVATPSTGSRLSASSVHFTPGARTAWHTHPNGQTIWVTEGIGLVQRRGGPLEVIRPGDRVFFEPGEDHWHGAAPNRFMTHLAMLEVDDEGNAATWGDHVTDEEYGAARRPGDERMGSDQSSDRVLPRRWGASMTTRTNDELSKIGASDELQIMPRRRDGTLRNPVTIWVVRVGDGLYVRSWRGRTGAWFRGTQVRHEGRIRAGGIEKDGTFVEVRDPDINDQIDAAYRTKYRRHAARYVNPMVAPEARAATIKLVPRSTGS